jgi:hypothetical protein
MSTRKLILTALVCGIVIMLAGGFKLLQISTDDSEVSFLAAGADATLGDMTISVRSVDQQADATRVTVTMVGVEGADALEGWRLVAAGEAVVPLVVSDGTACQVTSAVSPTTCVVTFPPSEGTVTVAYLRAGSRAQWSL